MAWNLSVDQRPEAVVFPSSAEEIARVVGAAREHGLRVAAQATGHGATPMGPLDGTVLVKTARMRGATVDAEARVARAEAGAQWMDVAPLAAEHGLAGLAGIGAGRRRRRLHARRRDRLARRASTASRRTASSRWSSSSPTGRRCGWTRRTSPTSSGPCAAGAAAFGIVTAIELALVDGAVALRRRPLLAVGARLRGPPRVARVDRRRAGGDDLARAHRPVPAAADAAGGDPRASSSCWSRRRSSATRRPAPSCSRRCARSGRRWTPSRRSRRRCCTRSTTTRPSRCRAAATACCSTRCRPRRSTRSSGVAGPGSGSPFIGAEIRHFGGALERRARGRGRAADDPRPVRHVLRRDGRDAGDAARRWRPTSTAPPRRSRRGAPTARS